MSRRNAFAGTVDFAFSNQKHHTKATAAMDTITFPELPYPGWVRARQRSIRSRLPIQAKIITNCSGKMLQVEFRAARAASPLDDCLSEFQSNDPGIGALFLFGHRKSLAQRITTRNTAERDSPKPRLPPQTLFRQPPGSSQLQLQALRRQLPQAAQALPAFEEGTVVTWHCQACFGVAEGVPRVEGAPQVDVVPTRRTTEAQANS